MSQNNYRSEIDNWTDLWDAMQDQGIHPEVEPVKPSSNVANTSHTKPQDTYYDFLESYSDFLESGNQNPIHPDSIGPDEKSPSPEWVSEDLLSEIEKLKNQLFDVENKIAKMGQGNKFSETPVKSDGQKDVFGQLESIKKQIEAVSNKLGMKDEPSQYKANGK